MTTSIKNSSFLNSLTRRISMDYLESLDSSVSLGIYLCLKYKDDITACSASIDPLHYNDYKTFRMNYLAACFLSKFRGGPSTLVKSRREAAIVKFWSCESRLTDRSTKFRNLLLSGRSTRTTDILYSARRKIAEILGSLKDGFSIDDCEFGPGSSSSIKRRKAHPSNKFISSDVSAGCAPFVTMFFRDLGLSRPKLNLVEHSRIEIVPKNFKADRVIAIEPDWNIFFQKGIGKLLRRRLDLEGIDLNRGSLRHAKLARLGSITNYLATIDLSSASDSLATFLIRFLLPEEWFIVLNSIRTDRVSIEGKVHPLMKFSSMGNGFTFELESLVFYALAYATGKELGKPGIVSVFGDDIICRSDIVSELKDVFDTCGIILNDEKSFSSSYFRESCGSHFFNGVDVKPYYLKENITDEITKYKFCNSLRRLSHRIFCRDVLDSVLFLPYSSCLNSLTRILRIPEDHGDGGLISYFDEVCPTTVRQKDSPIRRYSNCIEGYKVKCLLPSLSQGSVDHDGMLLHKLRSSAFLRRSTWHQQGYSHFLCKSLFDFKIADRLPVVGNLVSYSPERVKYRLGRQHVVQWIDPGTT